MNDFKWAESTLATARRQQAGKPLQNNTRLFQRGPDSYAVRLHNTDVITFNSDGTYALRSGGYHTVTTMDRIRNYAPVRQTLLSERGEWYVRLAPDPDDPRPARVERSIPKPFHATDPGPEPVKDPEGCVAGQIVTTEHVNEIVDLMWRKDMLEGDELIEVTGKGYRDDPDFDRVKVKRSWNSHVYIGEDAHSYRDEGWIGFPELRSMHNSSFTNDDGERVEYVQCSHCKDFDAVHERWRYRMYGERYGRRFDEPGGYAKYAQMIERFGTQEAWQQAYKADFRARRDYLKAEREWDQRNRVPFYEGIIVDSDGYAQRAGGPSKKKLDKHEREVAKVKKQIEKYIDGFIAALKQGMPTPGSGDCWYCCMYTEDGKAWGDMGDNDHLFSHMKEKYYVPSLAVNALRERGYKDVGIYMWLDIDRDNYTMGKPDGRYDGVKRDLRSYLNKRCIPAAPTK